MCNFRYRFIFMISETDMAGTVTQTVKRFCLLASLIFIFQFCNAMPTEDALPGAETDTIPPQLFTVARVWENPEDTSAYTVIFFQSARFYKLLKNNKYEKAALVLLNQSQKDNKPVKVYLTVQYGDIIAYVKANKK
jgi:hypothetical protein